MHSDGILMYLDRLQMCSESIRFHFAIIHAYFESMRRHLKSIRMQLEGM